MNKKKANMLTSHDQLSKLDLNITQMDFDATSLHPSAMWDKSSVIQKIKTGYRFKPHMNDIFVNDFNNKIFKKDGIDSPVSKMKHYNPPNLSSRNLAIKGRIKNIEVNLLRNGYIKDTLTSVDICENVKNGGKVIEKNDCVVYQENFQRSPFGKNIDKMFFLRKKMTKLTITCTD